MLKAFLRGDLGVVLGLAGLAVGIVGIALSGYFFLASRSLREPVFLVDPVRTQIVSKERISSAPIRVLKSDGSEIATDVTAIRFYFWNDGRESIRRSHLLRPLTILLSDPRGEILDFRALAASRDVSDLTIRRHTSNPNRTLQIDFEILEKHDGVSGQIIFAGDTRSALVIDGIIEGVGSIETNRNVSLMRAWRAWLARPINIIPSLACLVIFPVTWFMLGSERSTRYY